jgi:hypothetical protein
MYIGIGRYYFIDMLVVASVMPWPKPTFSLKRISAMVVRYSN